MYLSLSLSLSIYIYIYIYIYINLFIYKGGVHNINGIILRKWIRVQNLDGAVYISFCANALREGVNRSLLLQGQNELSSLGKATGLEERKTMNSKLEGSCSENMLHIIAPFFCY